MVNVMDDEKVKLKDWLQLALISTDVANVWRKEERMKEVRKVKLGFSQANSQSISYQRTKDLISFYRGIPNQTTLRKICLETQINYSK